MKTFARKWLMPLTVSLVLALALTVDALAAPRNQGARPSARPPTTPSMPSTRANAKSADEAARQAARQYDAAKVLSVKTVQQGNRRVHVVKLLTRDGVVKTVRVPADGR